MKLTVVAGVIEMRVLPPIDDVKIRVDFFDFLFVFFIIDVAFITPAVSEAHNVLILDGLVLVQKGVIVVLVRLPVTVKRLLSLLLRSKVFLEQTDALFSTFTRPSNRLHVLQPFVLVALTVVALRPKWAWLRDRRRWFRPWAGPSRLCRGRATWPPRWPRLGKLRRFLRFRGPENEFIHMNSTIDIVRVTFSLAEKVIVEMLQLYNVSAKYLFTKLAISWRVT